MDLIKNLLESQPDSQAETEIGQVTAAEYSNVRQRHHEINDQLFFGAPERQLASHRLA